MNSHTLQSTDQHQQISLLLPWYLNQSLELAERQQVENHIRGCMLCRRELVHLGKLAVAIKQAPDLDVAADASFNKLRAKLQMTRQQAESFDAHQPDVSLEKRVERNRRLTASATHRRQSFWGFIFTKGTRLAIAASVLVAIIPMAMLYGLAPTAEESYHTLSDAKPDSGNGIQLRVVFSKSLSDTDINALLAKINGERVEGPNSLGAYTVRLDSGKEARDLASAIAFLRGQQDVILAEPVVNQP